MITTIAQLRSRLSLVGFITSFPRKIFAYESNLLVFLLAIAFAHGAMFWSGDALAQVVYRVNSGGVAVSATPNWEADTKGNPSTFVNAAATGNKTFSTGVAIDLSDPSIPIGTPEAIFQSERWDPGASPEMQWDFPVTPGSYEVRLYFADIFSGTNSIGARVFDVSIEDALVLDDYDIFADVGGFTGVVKSFVVTSDGNLDIDFGHVVENPAIKGIEIIQAGSGDLGASPGSLDFGTVVIGNNSVQAVQLTNLGSTGDPDIVVSAAQLMGTDATEFSHDFGGAVTLGPGQSTTVTVGFNPANPTGAKSASLEFTHDGNASPLAVALTGNATAAGNPGELTATPTSVDFGDVAVGNSGSQAIQLTNAGIVGDPDIVVSAAQIIGTNATEFSHDFSGSVTLGPGQSTTVTVGFNPANPTGAKSASLEFTHDGNASPLAVALTGNATAAGGGSTVVYRVNSGGALVSATPDWEADTKGNPSTFVNAAATGNKTFSTGAAIDLSDPSIPVGTPEAIFQSERWDPGASPEMQWDFPVTPGSYEVRLYFADIFSGTNSIGARVFDVSIEDALVLDDYDIFADVGGFTGVVKSFVVASDGNLDIDFGHVVENPAIKGIEIIQGGPGDLGASPGSLDFGTVVIGNNSVQAVQLTNLGSLGDPDIEVQSTALTGIDAANFSDDFAGPVTLSPGQAITLNVTFSPIIVGNKTANLEFTHDGNNSPISIGLNGVASSSGPVGFGKSTLPGAGVNNPTSLQFGPDERLYVAQQDGLINIYTVIRNGPDDYSVTATESITEIQSIPNHDDDGTLNAGLSDRLVTGLYVVGTASNPVIYVNSSDPRIGAGPSGQDLNLDTNSGILSRLTWNGTSWDKLDLVVGLPRSEENHHGNGIALDAVNNILYIAYGGHTNAGATSNNFAFLPEFALSAAILSVDLDAIGETTHFLETLDDEDRPGPNDLNDPFGGNNGKNQAQLVPGGPVQIHAPGFRNPYDVIITQAGNMYTIDNGPNAGWGDVPVNEGTVNCTNAINEPGLTFEDTLHFVTGPGYYGGHANPTRGNMANTFNTSNSQSPVTTSNPLECDYLIPGVENGALETFTSSTNGLVEYTASNFGGAMQGDLLTASFSNQLFRLVLDPTGATVISKQALFSTVGSAPLDVTTQDDNGNLPGTIWVADVFGDSIVIFEPNDFDGGGGPICTGADDPQLDEDGDGYDNADEIDNGTDPCSSADVPPDADGDFTSDLNDPDDDNDSLPDTSDPFAIDGTNGSTTNLPISYTWENDDPNPGGLLNLGFTGLMTNNTSNYEALFDPTKMTAGGAAGVVTLDEISSGDAGHGAGDPDNQDNGFQFGVNVDENSGAFTAHTRIGGPFNGLTPEDFQSMGLFIGNGDQDNYVKIVLNANGGSGGVQSAKEENGSFSELAQDGLILPGPDFVDLYLEVTPSSLTVQASYEETSGGVTGPRTLLGSPATIPVTWLNGATKLAVGIISTSRGASSTFPGTWDFLLVTTEAAPSWQQAAPLPVALGEVAAGFIGNFMYLVGEGSNDTLAYDVSTDSWSPLGSLASRPFAGHHHAAEVVNGQWYLIGGLGASSGGRVQIYDPIGDSWTEGARAPFLSGSGASAVIGGQIYYAGGIVGSATVNQVSVYDPATDSWSGPLAPMPQGVNHAAAATDGSQLYVFGGRDGGNVVSNGFDYVQIYDPATDSWESSTDIGSTLAPLPQARGGMGKAVFFNGEFYVIGGETDTGAGATVNDVYDRVDIYNPVTNTWRLGDPMPTARHGIFPLLDFGLIHVAGGGVTNGNSQTTLFEVYNPN